jgi:hypothetical protein
VRRAGGRDAVGRRNRRLQVMQTAGRVYFRYVLLIDRAIHLLIHLEVLVDGIAGEGIKRHRWAGHLNEMVPEGDY